VAVVEAEPAQTASAEPAPAALPKTGSLLPLIGFVGMLSLAGSGGLRMLRK